MSETLITCPECGHEFGVSEALSERVRAEMETRLSTDYDKRLKNAVRAAEARARDAQTLELKAVLLILVIPLKPVPSNVQHLREHGIEPEEAEECFFHEYDYCKDVRCFDDV